MKESPPEKQHLIRVYLPNLKDFIMWLKACPSGPWNVGHHDLVIPANLSGLLAAGCDTQLVNEAKGVEKCVCLFELYHHEGTSAAGSVQCACMCWSAAYQFVIKCMSQLVNE